MSPKHPLSREPGSISVHIWGAAILLAILLVGIRLARTPGQIVVPPGGVPPAIQNSQFPTSTTPFAQPNPGINPGVSTQGIPSVGPSPQSPPVPNSSVPSGQTNSIPAQATVLSGNAGNSANPNWKFSLPTSPVNSLIGTPDGVLWAAHEDGLIRIAQNQAVEFSRSRQTFPSLNATALAYDGRSLWIGTFDGLLRTEDGRSFRRYTSRDGMIHDMVWSLKWDGSVLWIGTQAGVSFMTPDGRFERIDKKITNGGLADIWIGAIQRLDRFVCCGNDDGLSIWDTTQFAANPQAWVTLDMFASNLAHNWILCLTSFENKLWAGTPQGLCRLDATFEQVFQANADAQKNPQSLKSLWTVFNSGNGLPANKINAIQPWKNALWLGTPAGLCRFLNGGVKVWTMADGLLATDVRALTEVNDTLWVGSAGGIQAASPLLTP